MKAGLLWYDDCPHKTLTMKVLEAARHYTHRHNQSPNICYVHPSAMGDNGTSSRVGQVDVKVGSSVIRHHFWIGVEEEE